MSRLLTDVERSRAENDNHGPENEGTWATVMPKRTDDGKPQAEEQA